MKLARWLGIGGVAVVALLLLARFVVAQPGVTPNNLRTEGSALGASTMLRAFGLDTNISITCQPKAAGNCILVNPVISGFTAGSVIFAGASGALSQNNTNIFWDDTNFALGIGTNTPAVGAPWISMTGGPSIIVDSGGGLRIGLDGIGITSPNAISLNAAGTAIVTADSTIPEFTIFTGGAQIFRFNATGLVNTAGGPLSLGTTGNRWGTVWLGDIGTVVTTNRIFYPAMQFCKTDNLVVVLINTRVAANDWALSVTSAAGSTQNITCTFPLPFRTTASKGAKLTGLSIVSQIVTNNLTSNTFNALATTTYVNATANLVAAYGGAVTCTLPTVAQATPYVTACSIGTPAYMNTAAAQVSIDFTAVLAVAATTFRIYGVEAIFETATY